MRKRTDPLFLVGIVMVATAVMLFFIPIENKVEWVLGPALFYIGCSLTFVGAVMHYLA